MTAQTQLYLYEIRQYVVLLELSASPARRYEKVYAKDLTINRGVDNVIQFAFINQEQRPVNISGKDITFRILDNTGTKILIQGQLKNTLSLNGFATMTITAEQLAQIPAQIGYYSLEIPVNTFDYAVFVDEDGGARGIMNIVDSVLPKVVKSTDITIPSHLPPRENQPSTYYSSVYNTKESPDITMQVQYTAFTGNITFQGSTLADFSLYYDILGPTQYVDNSITDGFRIQGYHPYVRVKIENTGTQPPDQNNHLAGDINLILAR